MKKLSLHNRILLKHDSKDQDISDDDFINKLVRKANYNLLNILLTVKIKEKF